MSDTTFNQAGLNQTGTILPQGSPQDRGWFIGLGIVLLLTGAGALLFPMLVSLSINILVGLTLLISGVFTAVHAFRSRGWSGFGLELLLALIYLGGGLLFLFVPLAGLFALTVTLGALFAADGVGRIILALKIRPERAWAMFLISGLISLALGVIVLIGLPTGASLSILGILVGVNMIFAGMSFLLCNGNCSLPKAG